MPPPVWQPQESRGHPFVLYPGEVTLSGMNSVTILQQTAHVALLRINTKEKLMVASAN